MRLLTLPTPAAVAAAAADLLAEVVAREPRARVILPAGKTPLALYAELLRRARTGELPLDGVRFFQLDEYLGPGPSDARSFHALLRKELLDPLGRAPGHDALLDGSAADPAAEIARHARALTTAGGAHVAFLGIGTNGHVAFNEPGTRRDDGARVVPLAAATRAVAAAEFAPDPAPTHGITLGLAEIGAARKIGLMATGASKAAILAALLEQPASTERPASLLGDHADFTLFADTAAAAGRRHRTAGPS
ncbi:MAG: glucosamine-6-phosphate deaminase [Planctomycetes bacterium]|nr:glucosamine-6-phosphate deaminase [Planctomycetota bacterium]